MLYSSFCYRSEGKHAAEQDVLFCLLKNDDNHPRRETTTEKNDVIGVSCLQLPLLHYSVPKPFHNFYNCMDYSRSSYFTETKLLIVG